MLIFNVLGLLMFAVSFALAFAIGRVIGHTAEGPVMMIAGPLLMLLDLGYRWRFAKGQWLHRRAGGSLFFLPAWGLGAFWFLLGAYYAMRH